MGCSSRLVSIWLLQACLHTIVGALYSRSIYLKPATVEMTLRAAVFLEMPCIIEACVAFIKKYVIKQAPLEVIKRSISPPVRLTCENVWAS